MNIREFLEHPDREELFAQAYSKVDVRRREKADCIRQERAKAASLGAGLLLQLAVQEAQAETQAGRELAQGGFRVFTVIELLTPVLHPLPLEYRYGKGGKPYLNNFPWYFNLSHSGDYVLCVLSEREVGADIQIHREQDVMKLAGRFFPGEETEALLQAEDRNSLFFRLWARKEAYGKLTGEGLAEVIGKNLQAVGGDSIAGLCWEECDILSDYSIAICQYKE